jgi:hypothetical protein
MFGERSQLAARTATVAVADFSPEASSMAAPTDLSKAWWQKHKPATLKSTGFGKALEDWAKAEALVFSNANIKTKIAALQAVEAARAKAVGMCNKVLHGDALKALEVYKTLIAKESQALQRDGEKYHKLVAAWHKVRADILVEMKVRQQEWETLGSTLDKLLVQAAGAAQGNDPAKKEDAKQKLAKAAQLVTAQRQKTKDTVDQNRLQAAVDDKAMNVFGGDKDDSDFQKIVKIQAESEGDFSKYDGLIKECLAEFA